MNITELTYPDFVANQVLTSSHLNDLRGYLDEQTRLTRAHLIGVGIACGLEVEFDAPGTIHLSRGVGVTTQGYLAVEPDDVRLVSARPYTLPTNPGYGPFVDSAQDPAAQFDMWELFDDDDVPGAVALPGIGGALAEKAVVLFLELDRAEALTCSPVDCDDRGPTVTGTLRRLLVDVTDLDKIIAAGDAVAPPAPDMAQRLMLPDLRMPRFDVPATGVAASDEVLRAFQETFRANKLAAAVADALTALHRAFHPLLGDAYPQDPFSSFFGRLGFLDSIPEHPRQVLFLQYYWDFFDDLLAAYDETRWAGVELMCVCCPPEGWFPRHLMAGVLDPSRHDPGVYRHRFLRSPAVGDCVARTTRFRALFDRLVRMVADFTAEPPVSGVRVTPSRWGQAALSDKAIPYYYDPKGRPPLHRFWDPEKTAHGRALHNLGYHAVDHVPAPPAFVREPLRFDLEPNNFLRIEGHLGADVREVLRSLLELKQSHRLPFEVVALRAGSFDEDAPMDIDEGDCRFEDLVTLYRVLQAELECLLAGQLRYFYALPDGTTHNDDPVDVSNPVLKKVETGMKAQPGTLGHVVETVRARRAATSWLSFVTGTRDVPGPVFELVASLSDLHMAVPERIADFDPQKASEPLQRVRMAADRIDEVRRNGTFEAPGLSERLEDLTSRCQLAPLQALQEEFLRRARDVLRAQYLGNFLAKHPGIQHKAGVPLGGTFILVHHVDPASANPDTPPGPDVVVRPPGGTATGPIDGPGVASANDPERTRWILDLLNRVETDSTLHGNDVVRKLVREMTGRELRPRRTTSSVTEKVYREAVGSLPAGAVIADFFLPYCCCSDCTPIQFTLPTPRLDVTAQVGCTTADGFAAVVLTASGADGVLSVQVNGGAFQETTGTLPLPVGNHTLVVRDAVGNESRALQVTVPPQLLITQTSTRADDGHYEVRFTVQGGTAPYEADRGTVRGNEYRSGPIPAGEVLEVKVTDARSCSVTGTFEAGEAPCDLPCGGDAIRAGYRFWLPEAQPRLPINEYKAHVESFVLVLPDGSELDLTGEVAEIINQGARPIRTADFLPLVREKWLVAINRLVEEHVGSPDWFSLDYEPPEGTSAGTLLVDHLVCIEFRFMLGVTWTQGDRTHDFWIVYSPKGTEVHDRQSDGKAFLPLMGGSTSNKCRPGEPPTPRCQGTDLNLVIQPDMRIPNATFHAEFSGSEDPVAFFWEIQDGFPSLSGDREVQVHFKLLEPVVKQVRLTGFTKSGCTVVVEKSYNLREWG